MSTNSAIQVVNFKGRDPIDEDAVWLNMEQVPISETSQNANLFDIFQMMGMSASGLTAFSYTPPGLDYIRLTATSIEIDLDFWVFLFNLDLAYSLSINQGSLSSRKYEEVNKIGNIVIPLSDKVQTPYLIKEDSSFEWETPVYDSVANLLSDVPITVKGPYLVFPEDVFGIIRAGILAQGYRYTATLKFSKSKAGRDEIKGLIKSQASFSSITNVACSVVCTFIDEDGKSQEEVLELKIPKIVADFLAECPDGSLRKDPRCENSSSESGRYKTKTTIYYSTCTGEILDTVRTDFDSGGDGCDNE